MVLFAFFASPAPDLLPLAALAARKILRVRVEEREPNTNQVDNVGNLPLYYTDRVSEQVVPLTKNSRMK